MTDIVDLGASKLDERTNALLVQCKSSAVGVTDDEAPDFGDTPVFGAGCVTGIPWPKDDRGSAQGIIDESLPGTNGAVTGWRDTRVAKVVAEMKPGEGCLHSTGPEFDSRVFCKDQLVAIVVGNDTTITVDRKNKKISIVGFGCNFSISEAGGIAMTDGKAMIQVKDGVISLSGQVVLGGRTPLGPVQFGPAPVVGTAGASAPAQGVFVGGP